MLLPLALEYICLQEPALWLSPGGLPSGRVTLFPGQKYLKVDTRKPFFAGWNITHILILQIKKKATLRRTLLKNTPLFGFFFFFSLNTFLYTNFHLMVLSLGTQPMTGMTSILQNDSDSERQILMVPSLRP